MVKRRQKSNILDIVPCRRPNVLTEREGNHTMIAYPRFKRAWMQRLLVPKGMSSHICVQLEEHGAAVWERIDGQATVQEIIEQLASHFKEEKRYEERIIVYLFQLEKDGFISFYRSISPST